VLVRPEQITLALDGADSSPASGRIVRCDYHGHDTVFRVQLETEQGGTILLARTLGNAALAPGQRVGLTARGPVLIWH
jgi:iron(III) transport system ATP-binding protein